jgi:hypothetical protein
MADVIAGMVLFLALLSAAVLSFRLVGTLVCLGKIRSDWEIQCAATAVLFASLLVIVVEWISLLQVLSAFGLAAGWIFASFLIHIAHQHLAQKVPAGTNSPGFFPPESADWTAEEKVLCQGMVWTLAVLFVISFFAAPTTRDPLTQDLTRVLYWIQNGSAAHFATHDLDQIRSAPFPAFVLLHAYLLSDSDQLAGLVPWISLVLSLIFLRALTGCLARRLSKTPPAASLRNAKVWTATLSLCVLLAVAAVFPTFIDLMSVFWIVSITLFGLLLISAPGNLAYALGLAASLALSVLSNEDLALAALLLALIFLVISAARPSGARIRIPLVFTLTAVVLAAPHHRRNLEVFGTAFALPAIYSQLTFLILLVPLVALAVASKFNRPIKIVLAAVLGLMALASIFLNPARPILGSDFLFQNRERQRFLGASRLYEPATEAVNDILISGSTNVALHIQSPDDALARIEYAVWSMFGDRGFDRLYHVGATNVTARLSNPPEIQALLTSSASSDEINKYKLSYGPLRAFWTELDSRWIQLTQLSPDRTHRILSSTNQELLQFDGNSATLSCRVARQGVLTLEGGFGDRKGLLKFPTALSLKSRAGFVTTSRSTNALHLVEIPIPPGQTEINLNPAFRPPEDTVFALRSWSWYPTEQPLPFIYISKMTSPASALEPNTIIVGNGSDLTIEFVSGAVGVIDLQFYASGVDNAPLDLVKAAFRTNVTFRAGTAIARLPIERGTNHFTVSSTNALLLDRIEPRFRDFLE